MLLPRLRAERLRRHWTEADLAVAIVEVAEALGEAPPRIDGNQVSKWERGDRSPGLYYRSRLCLALECGPERLGFTATPRLVRMVRELMERLAKAETPLVPSVGRQRRDRHSYGAGGLDAERLEATLRHLWPVDRPLLDGLDRASRHLALRRDTELPSQVVPDLSAFHDMLIELLSRTQRPGDRRDLCRIAAFVGQNLAMANWVAGDLAGTYRTYAIAESLARDSRSGAQLALVLVDRSEMAGQVARTTGEWEEARQLADAAETAALMDPSTPPGVLAWIYGERSGHRAMLGDDRGSSSDLERVQDVRLGASQDQLNVFSPTVDTSSGWIDVYRVRSALRRKQDAEAIEVCEHILTVTDRQLLWQVTETTVLLSEAWLIKGELGASAHWLERAAELARSAEDERDTRAVRGLLNRMRQRWPGAPQVRRLDELIRSSCV